MVVMMVDVMADKMVAMMVFAWAWWKVDVKAAKTVDWTESTTVASKVVEMVATSADSLDDTTGYWKVAQTALLMDTTWAGWTASK